MTDTPRPCPVCGRMHEAGEIWHRQGRMVAITRIEEWEDTFGIGYRFFDTDIATVVAVERFHASFEFVARPEACE